MRTDFVYLDSSVALAEVLAEDAFPPPSLWSERLVASRLLAYECWMRLHRAGLAKSHGDALRAVLSRVALLDLVEPVVGSAIEGVAGGARTLDALHLATMRFLIEQDQEVRLATYDRRFAATAAAAGIELVAL